MTRFAFVALGGLALSACTSTAPAEVAVGASVASVAPEARGVVTVGEIADGAAMSVDDALAQSVSLDGQTVRVAGTIRQVCQANGCWLTFASRQGETLRVMTHGEGEAEELLFPRDASGRRAEVVGTLRLTEESVERRRHLAHDAGASEAEIAAITAPSRSVAIVATGARISM